MSCVRIYKIKHKATVIIFESDKLFLDFAITLLLNHDVIDFRNCEILTNRLGFYHNFNFLNKLDNFLDFFNFSRQISLP